MAEKLEIGTAEYDAMEFKRAGGGSSRYPWDEWLDGSKWKLKRKEDFPGTELKYMAIRARLVGKKRGLTVRTVMDKKNDVLGIQALPKAETNGEAGEQEAHAPKSRKRK